MRNKLSAVWCIIIMFDVFNEQVEKKKIDRFVPSSVPY